MSETIQPEPAFPVSTMNATTGHQDGSSTWQFPGMTLRDYFAAKALPTLIDVSIDDMRNGQPYADYVSKIAYEMADAMLKARSA